MEVPCDGCEGSKIAKFKMCWHDEWKCQCPELSVMCGVCGGKGYLTDEEETPEQVALYEQYADHVLPRD